jgi:hypothetical protein
MVFGTILTLRRDAFLSPALRVYLTHMYLAYKIAHNTGIMDARKVHKCTGSWVCTEDLVSVSLCARPRGLKWLVNGERDRTIRQARYFHMFAARCKRAIHISRDAKRRSWNHDGVAGASRGNKLKGSAECVVKKRERERERENLSRSCIFPLPSSVARSTESRVMFRAICSKSILWRIISASSSAVNQHACARSSNFGRDFMSARTEITVWLYFSQNGRRFWWRSMTHFFAITNQYYVVSRAPGYTSKRDQTFSISINSAAAVLPWQGRLSAVKECGKLRLSDTGAWNLKKEPYENK